MLVKKLFILLIILFGFSVEPAITGNFVRVKIGEYNFCIPKENTVDSSFFDWIYTIPGLDKDVGSVLFNIQAEDLAEGIPGYKIIDNRGIKLDSGGLMQYLSDEDREAGRHTTGLSDVWRKQGAYKYRYVEYDKKLKLYKVFSDRDQDSQNIWDLFSQYPDETKSVPDLYSFHIASCRYGVEINNHEAPINCTLSFIGARKIDTTASISGENLHLYKEIREFVRSKINEWKNNCK